MLTWAAAYAVVLAVMAGIVLARREPTVVRGEWVLLLNATFALGAAVAAVAGDGGAPAAGIAVSVALLAAGWVARQRWLIVRAPLPAVGDAIDECGRRLCAVVERSGRRYAIGIPGEPLHLRLASAPIASTVITFENRPTHRKAALFRTLLGKQYHRVLPTIRMGAAP